MSTTYSKPLAADGTIRLHLNENTAGCSPRVLEVVRGFTARDVGSYPDYAAATAAAAAHFGVPAECVLLTNGLDEGILAATMTAFRSRGARTPEGVGVLPTFDMYEVAVTALGGTMTSVPLGDEFMFSADAVAAAVNDATRIVFVTSPHNPTGRAVPLDVLRRLAERVAPAMFFLDEAYAGFTGETLIDADVFAALPNLVVGRTFAKAHGLAGLRAGAVFAAPALMESIRKVVPPYSLNAVAAAALPAALDDREYTAWYYDQCRASRALLAAACSRLGLRSFPSVTNFMLVEIGPRAAALAAALAARGVAVRDRSASPGSPGCLRMTTGRVDDTERLVAALEDAWRAGA